MVITKDLLVKLLNMDLELEYSTAIQYINHASLINKTPSYKIISREITEDALEEMQHAAVLANQISHFGGCPSARVAQVYLSDDGREMLRHDLYDKAEAIRRYSTRIHQAEQLEEYNLARNLRDILAMEQEHLLDFEYKDASRRRERTANLMETADYNEFSKKWAERASHVPLRAKRNNQ